MNDNIASLPKTSNTPDDLKFSVYSKEDVKRIRKDLKFTQPKFAKLLGVSVDTVKTWESGRYTISASTQRLLFLIEEDNSIIQKLLPDEKLQTKLSLDEK